jgi:hypothetical protein
MDPQKKKKMNCLNNSKQKKKHRSDETRKGQEDGDLPVHTTDAHGCALGRLTASINALKPQSRFLP